MQRRDGWFGRMAGRAALGAGLFLGALAASAQAEQLDGDTIRERIAGKRVYLAVPFGGEFPLYYRRDGRVDGSGEALGLGRFLRPTDSGRWWVAGDRLCQRWQVWYEGKTMCFTLIDLGDGKLRWNQDNGDTGLARLGN